MRGTFVISEKEGGSNDNHRNSLCHDWNYFDNTGREEIIRKRPYANYAWGLVFRGGNTCCILFFSLSVYSPDLSFLT